MWPLARPSCSSIGHYGVAFAAKPVGKPVPLWVWFIAVQWLDVIWSILVLMGIEKLHIVPGFTEANALDLYYMPFTHSLPGSIVLSLILGGIVGVFTNGNRLQRSCSLRPRHFHIGSSISSCTRPICRSTTMRPRSALDYGGTLP
jgi:hypothetical protein